MLAQRHTQAVAAQHHRHPGTALATLSRSGNRSQPAMLIGLTDPVCRSIGPAEAMPTAVIGASAARTASAIIASTTAHTSPAAVVTGVGRIALCTSAPAESTSAAAILVPPMSRQRVGMVSVPVGVVGLAWVAGMLVAGREPHQLGAAGV